MGVPPVKKWAAPISFFDDRPMRFCMVRMRYFSGKFLGIDSALLPNREWNQRQKHKKQPWSKVECFAFGGATVRFASLETSSHAANPQSLRHPLTRAHHIAPRIKTARRFTAKNP